MKLQEMKELTNRLFKAMEEEPENSVTYRNQIVEVNIKLVAHVLKKYVPYTEDQYQTGCMGLIFASMKYKRELNVPFANFACLCIERELQNNWNKNQRSFEAYYADKLLAMDRDAELNNGDSVNIHDTIEDEYAAEAFERVLNELSMTKSVNDIIMPAIEIIAGGSRGQKSTMDVGTWKQLEFQYVIEMALEDSCRARLTFSSMAKELGVSVQYIKTRHIRVMNQMQQLCIENGILLHDVE